MQETMCVHEVGIGALDGSEGIDEPALARPARKTIAEASVNYILAEI